MKKIKYMLIGLLAVLLIFGLWYGKRSKAGEYTKTEYVLDTTCSVTFYGDNAEAAAKAEEEARLAEEKATANTRLLQEIRDLLKKNNEN